MRQLIQFRRESANLLGGGTGVDELAVVVDETLDLTLAFEVADGDTGKGAVDLHAVNECRLRNHLECGHFLEDSVVCRSVEHNHVLGLIAAAAAVARRSVDCVGLKLQVISHLPCP